MNIKVYVEVTTVFTSDGRMIPKSVRWEDGKEYIIDKVKDCRRVASLKAGGVGDRYTCLIQGFEKHLYYEGNNMWFMERAVVQS